MQTHIRNTYRESQKGRKNKHHVHVSYIPMVKIVCLIIMYIKAHSRGMVTCVVFVETI